MGVPKFYRWISERYPCLSEVLKEYQVCFVKKSLFSVLYKIGDSKESMTKYRKGPQKTHKGPQRSITQDHRGSAIMRELPNLQQFCLI